MTIENEILINQYAQDLVGIKELLDLFSNLSPEQKKAFLNDTLFFIIQSKAIDKDIEEAILESKLKSTLTACVLLRKGVLSYNLKKLINLPDKELESVFILLLCLFKLAYKRRLLFEKNNLNKWWYQDLSDAEILKKIRIKG